MLREWWNDWRLRRAEVRAKAAEADWKAYLAHPYGASVTEHTLRRRMERAKFEARRLRERRLALARLRAI